MITILMSAALATQPIPSDVQAVAELDRSFQAATKRNDAVVIEGILHPQFQLVLGNGTKVGRERLISNARDRVVTYELQDEEEGSQSVILAGDTAVVTAKLLLKGTVRGEKFDRTLWFSDTYVRTPLGWRYLFGQASLPLSTGAESAGMSQSGSVSTPER